MGKKGKTLCFITTDRAQTGELQEDPVSIVQVLLHPSPLTLLRSSHCSLDSLVPSPQVRKSPVQVQYVLPASEDLPASQMAQVEATVAPTAAENLPAVQLVQLEAPTAAEYVPAVQLVQAEAPVNAMYVPEGHNKQVVADADVDPVCPYFPAEHRVPEHVEFTVAPTAVEYVPDPQSVQTVEAVSSAYLPAPHEVHAAERESVLFIGTQFSNLYTAVDTPSWNWFALACCTRRARAGTRARVACITYFAPLLRLIIQALKRLRKLCRLLASVSAPEGLVARASRLHPIGHSEFRSLGEPRQHFLEG